MDLPVKDGQVNDCIIDTFFVTPVKANEYNSLFPKTPKLVSAIYKRLLIKNKTSTTFISSNTPFEISIYDEFINQAKGKILINGLRLGISLLRCILNTNVKSITVIEPNSSIFKLVSPFYTKKGISLLNVNPLEASDDYDYVLNDFWVDSFPLKEVKELTRKFKNANQTFINPLIL